MNNNHYFSPSADGNALSFNYSPSPTYCYTPFLPLRPPCPVHSSQVFHQSAVSPMSYTYEQSPVYSPTIQQHTVDRTPLRRHHCFKKNELEILHQVYRCDPYPSSDVLQQLILQLNVSIDKIRQWFKNRRHSDKQKRREVPTNT